MLKPLFIVFPCVVYTLASKGFDQLHKMIIHLYFINILINILRFFLKYTFISNSCGPGELKIIMSFCRCPLTEDMPL